MWLFRTKRPDGNALLTDLAALMRCLPAKRRFQLSVLFVLQFLSALSEVVSLGAVVPFLTALTDTDMMQPGTGILRYVDFIGVESKAEVIGLMAAIFVIAIVAANAIRFMTLWFQLYLGASIGTDLGAILFQKTLYKPYAYFIRHNSSEMITGMTNDLNATLGIVYNILALIAQGLIALAIIAGLLMYRPVISIVLGTVVLSSYALMIFALKGRLHRNSRTVSDSYRGIIKSLQEGFGGIGFITLNRSWDFMVNQYRQADRAFRISNAENSVIRQAPRFLIESIGVLMISVVAVYMISNTQDLAQVIPLIGFIGLAAHKLLPAGQQIYVALSSILGLRVSLTRTLEIFMEETPAHVKNRDIVPEPLTEEILLDDVWFSYAEDKPEESWTLKGISLSVKAGTKVAFIGKTGSGKSTVVDLILGLLAPQKGCLLYDGQALCRNKTGAWHATVSCVPQHIFLTDATLAENIAFGVEEQNIDMDRVIEAATLARIDDFIQGLPERYQTLAGERGVRLSGGQIQRIGIARALYKRPSVLIFDEATSALDTETEKEVMAAIHNLGRDITVILIAHRLSTVRNVDKIFLLEQGRLIEQGRYEELLGRCEDFKNLVGRADLQ